MPYVHDDVLDGALTVITDNADRLDICSQEPVTYTEATSTYTLGYKDHGAAGSAFGTIGDATPTGRKIASTAVTDGAVTATDTATHWGASDTTNSKLMAASSLSASQAVTSGNSFSLPSFDITLPDPS